VTITASKKKRRRRFAGFDPGHPMCGIAGSLGSPSGDSLPIGDSVQRMIMSLAHRGPDDAGIWFDAHSSICLGNRRLSILDVSHAGHQPMHSAGGRYVVTLNGEIYNHESLRTKLSAQGEAPTWLGSSDTEVLTACFEAWGIEATVAASVGMFAIAIWDRELRTLTLARDRIGEKPLFFGRFRGTWLFGSEIKALAAHPSFRRSIDPAALSAYMALGYIPAPVSIYRNVAKVRPGHLVTLRIGDDRPTETPYWSAIACANQPKYEFTHDVEAIDALEGLLTTAVSQQMVTDRPFGALLSGGIDSSSIVALMCAQRTSRLETFSIGFRESAFNEAHYAATVARHFGTMHTEMYVDANDVRNTIPLLPQIYDEPFADISQIPTFLVSRLASRSVTVALTGDGGDELFGGYPRYAMGARLWPQMQRLPNALRSTIGELLKRTPRGIDRAFTWAFPHDEESGIRGLRPAQKLTKLGRVFRSHDIETLYWQLLAPWAEPQLLREPGMSSPFPADIESFQSDSIEENFMLRDLVGYLPDDILTKIDRAAMSVSLESRAPLLDHRVVEFALRLPRAYKFRGGVGKWLLRQVLYRHIPRQLVDRPKMGFGIPIASWLRGPLKSWAYELIHASRSDSANLLDLQAVEAMLDRHVAGVGDWHQPIWNALMFLNWVKSVDAQLELEREGQSMYEPSGIDWIGVPEPV
jgi:asparagine synthase (glutamine-hydrolysing)